jgi:hypothetical protein
MEMAGFRRNSFNFFPSPARGSAADLVIQARPAEFGACLFGVGKDDFTP